MGKPNKRGSGFYFFTSEQVHSDWFCMLGFEERLLLQKVLLLTNQLWKKELLSQACHFTHDPKAPGHSFSSLSLLLFLQRHVVHVLCSRPQWAESTKLEKFLGAKNGSTLNLLKRRKKEAQWPTISDLLDPHQKWVPRECGLPHCWLWFRTHAGENIPKFCLVYGWCRHDVRREWKMRFIFLICIPINTLDAFAINNTWMSAYWHFSRSAELWFMTTIIFILNLIGSSKFAFN